MPLEPMARKSFAYESDGTNRYQIGIFDPALYEFKELLVKNGRIIPGFKCSWPILSLKV